MDTTKATRPLDRLHRSRDETVAVHEAGHAIIALLHGIGVEYAMLKECGAGLTQPVLSDRTAPYRHEVECEIWWTMAGRSAQSRNRSRYDNSGALADLAIIEQWWQKLEQTSWSFGTFWSFVGRRNKVVDGLVDWAWPAIEELARRLLDERTVRFGDPLKECSRILPLIGGAPDWLSTACSELQWGTSGGPATGLS